MNTRAGIGIFMNAGWRRFFAAAVMIAVGCRPCRGEDERMKRNRGEGLYHTMSANTPGSGNIWVTGRGIGFVWDDPADEGLLKPFPFLETRCEAGILTFASVVVESRLLSYFWERKPQFGTIVGGAKFTLPNNKDLRYHGAGLEIRYIRSFVENFASLGGYRYGGTGFSPEGFMVEGGSLQFKALYERDFLAVFTRLPFKTFVNIGMKLPMEEPWKEYRQYLLDAGAAYTGLSFDIFVEYSMIGFTNKSVLPRKFEGWPGPIGGRKWEVAFSENPMYLTPGARIRYPSGLSLMGCIPLLLSKNQGSDMTYGGDYQRLWEDFPDEKMRGVKDPFDPWFARWKIVGEISLPLRFRQTGSEMRRAFLLMKNRGGGTKIDIDERLDALKEGRGDEGETTEEEAEEKENQEEEDRRRRLERIRKRKEKIREETR